MATDESHSRLVWLLSPTDMADLKGLGDKRAYEAGKTLFREGDRVSEDDGSDYAVLILSGRVRVTAVGIDGREVLLAERDPPAIVGELSAIDRQRRSATVTVIEPGEAVVIGAKTRGCPAWRWISVGPPRRIVRPGPTASSRAPGTSCGCRTDPVLT